MASDGPDHWIVRRPIVVLLVALDLILISLLIAWGLTEHAVNPVDRPVYTLRTIVPFAIGWLIMSPVAGAYSTRALRSMRVMALATFAGWIGAAVAGVAIRATPLVPGSGDPVFLLVMIGTGLLVLLPWRVCFCFLHIRYGSPDQSYVN